MNAYIKLSTLEYPRHIGDIEIDPAGMEDYAPVEWVEQPPFDEERERCFVGTPIQENGVWKTTWNIIRFPDKDKAMMVRASRNQLLKDSDWTQLDDTPFDSAKKMVWANYRQALRDIPDQTGFPWEVQWPTQPE